jgi:hypothetical protein
MTSTTEDFVDQQKAQEALDHVKELYRAQEREASHRRFIHLRRLVPQADEHDIAVLSGVCKTPAAFEALCNLVMDLTLTDEEKEG